MPNLFTPDEQALLNEYLRRAMFSEAAHLRLHQQHLDRTPGADSKLVDRIKKRLETMASMRKKING